MFGRKKKQVLQKEKKAPVTVSTVSNEGHKLENVKNDGLDTELHVTTQELRTSTKV